MQTNSLEFQGLSQKMIPNEPFINREISYINFDGDMKLLTVSNYMKEFLSINEIDN